MTEVSPPVRVEAETLDQVSYLVVSGVLDSVTYRGLRDAVIKAALDVPRAVIVDVNALSVPCTSAWSVFTSARWHVSTWPDVPVVLVCESARARRGVASSGVARYVPVHPTLESALRAVEGRSLQIRRRARAELPAGRAGVGLARALITDWLTGWDAGELIPVAGTVAAVLVENVLDHTESTPVLISESYRGTVSVAVEDCSHQPATRRESVEQGPQIVSGLALVAALSRAWGSTPTPTGKTVWALVGRENRI